MKAIAYVRVSTASQVEDGVSMEAQQAKIRAWAEVNEYDAVEVFRDDGISGKRADNRTGLQEALDVVGKGDALVVYSLSRLSRSTKDTLSIAEALQSKGADLVSLSEKIDTSTAAGKMVFRMLAVLSEFERDQVAERTRAALRYKRERGEKTGGDVPYGYRSLQGNLVEHGREQTAIQRMRELSSSGLSLRAICRALERDGFKRKNGASTWHPQAVARILSRQPLPGIQAKAA